MVFQQAYGTAEPTLAFGQAPSEIEDEPLFTPRRLLACGAFVIGATVVLSAAQSPADDPQRLADNVPLQLAALAAADDVEGLYPGKGVAVLGGWDVVSFFNTRVDGETIELVDSVHGGTTQGMSPVGSPTLGSVEFKASLTTTVIDEENYVEGADFLEQAFVETEYEFWFSSEENLNEFLVDPWKYAPAYGGYCSFGMAQEMNDGDAPSTDYESEFFGVYCDPACPPGTPFAWYIDADERLFVFLDSDAEGLWLAHEDDFKAVADERWVGWWGSLEAGVFNVDTFEQEDIPMLRK